MVTAEQKVLRAVAMQLMNGEDVVLDEGGQKLRVKARRERAIADGGVQVEWAGV
jgi:hypothetical protein